MTCGAGDARQPLRSDHHQRYNTDNRYFPNAEVEHCCLLRRASFAKHAQECVLSLISPSMVWPVPVPEGSIFEAFCACVFSSSVFIPSLKPLTALPRSVPRLRSFLVPKMSTTTTRTIIQCQMLNEPMSCSC